MHYELTDLQHPNLANISRPGPDKSSYELPSGEYGSKVDAIFLCNF